MDRTKYGIEVTLSLDFDKAVEKTVACLKDQGFGVLSDIDVEATFKKKLGVDFRRYRILGACNPPLAHKALSAEEDIGLLLPCNVIVCEVSEFKTKVAAIDPVAALSLVDSVAIKPIAEEVQKKLISFVLALEESTVQRE